MGAGVILWGDLETYSETPIKHGTYRYAADAEIMLFTYAFDDGPVHCWDVTEDETMPCDLVEALLDDGCILIFQNSMFDRSVFRLGRHKYQLLRDVGNQIHRWRDTMVKALTHSLPGGLDKTGFILGLRDDEAKTDGKAFIHLFCKPRPKNSTLRRATRHTHPQEWEDFKGYAMRDTGAMRTVDGRLPNWNYKGKELALWHLDQKINDRGVLIDVEFAKAAIEAAEKEKKRLAVRTVELTNGEVESATKRDKLLAHILQEYGVDLPDMQASTLERRVNDPELPKELRELLDIRMQASMGSTSKYKSMLNAVNDDGYVRGLLQFSGANRTRRWAGRTVQPQNMFRPPKYIKKQWEFAIEAIRLGAADIFFDNVMEATAATARGAIIAPKGKKLVVADLSNIEGRAQAWLAGEQWKLQAFREYDEGSGHDLYKLSYARAFRIEPDEVDDYMRQIGKVFELMLGYEGGVGAFLTGALTYGFDVEEMAEGAYEHLPHDLRTEAEEFYEWTTKKRRSTFGLSDRAFVTCDTFKRAWRGAHPEISAGWDALQGAVIRAISSPNTTFECGLLKARRDGAWLRIGMPSGQCLCYPQPRVENFEEIWYDKKGNPTTTPRYKGEVSYAGVNQYTRKWQRVKTYGGKLFENVCQSLSRDFLASSMPTADAEGYDIRLTVHDEIISYAPDSDEFSAGRLCEIMATVPEWAEGMPLAAAGYESYRYRKD